jgi:hypothetical protein
MADHQEKEPEMPISFQMLVQRSAMLKYGLLGIAAGIGLAIFGFASDQSMPERAALQKIEGEITKATQITTTRKRGGQSVRYELVIKGASPEPVTLSIPQKEISEAQVKSILPTKIAAEYDSENDVYVLTSNGRPVISYENAVKSRQDNNNSLEIIGAIISVLSAMLAGIAFWWTRRKLRKEIAEWEAYQAQQPQVMHSTQPTA